MPSQGFFHLALQTGLPIVPMVLTGTHLAWRKGSLHIRPAPLNVKFLPPISTKDWTADKIDDYIRMVHDLYAKHLPESQRPLPLESTRNSWAAEVPHLCDCSSLKRKSHVNCCNNHNLINFESGMNVSVVHRSYYCNKLSLLVQEPLLTRFS